VETVQISTENIEALGRKAARLRELADRILAARTPAEIARIGVEEGFPFAEAELAIYLGLGELDDATLDAVGGGAASANVGAGDLLIHRWQSSMSLPFGFVGER
jgi:hypothetical protein